jgi:hypothetical protein
MNIDLKSLLIGFLFATCIYMYMESQSTDKPSFQGVSNDAGVIVIDTNTGEVVYRDTLKRTTISFPGED